MWFRKYSLERWIKVFADTTDGRGLVRDLTEKGIDLKDKEIIILGAGGSAKQ